ncbi:AbrB/MazE/SpoVT family DNA-binding domain-containing protein [Nitrospina watsonii]|uniref:SpoVT-AbrB domain-containing protein n=1 Tax=Nitrospina watsonii TaxID=1323948 RepID=A0ABN8W6H3_9BACT|nr:AbrB/MazE/SpoVT family DNA-binding domain-containing protein [Nitrospina watsonii]CAI2719231.1 SpoVT-AbrB domain-containing protein [Nitrospina watsonii]
MSLIKMSSKNQIVIPKEAREAMKVKGGDTLMVVVKGHTTLLLPQPKQFSRALSGRGKGLYPKDYLEKERKAW